MPGLGVVDSIIHPQLTLWANIFLPLPGQVGTAAVLDLGGGY